jgi:hypothetical protein
MKGKGFRVSDHRVIFETYSEGRIFSEKKKKSKKSIFYRTAFNVRTSAQNFYYEIDHTTLASKRTRTHTPSKQMTKLKTNELCSLASVTRQAP